MEQNQYSQIDRIRSFLSRKQTLYQIGIVNTLSIVGVGSLIAYTASIADYHSVGILATVLTVSSALVCYDIFNERYGITYEYGAYRSHVSLIFAASAVASFPPILLEFVQVSGTQMAGMYLVLFAGLTTTVVGYNYMLLMDHSDTEE